MIKLKAQNETLIKLQKGNKIIERPLVNYTANKKVWEFRGFKPVQDNVKVNEKEVDKTFENETKVVKLKPKKRKTRKKKNEPINTDES